MPDENKTASLEERRFSLEERKWSDEIALRKAELKAKEREGNWTAKIFSPLTATLIAGIVTVIGSVIATLIQNNQSLRLERQKEQHDLILKMITGTDEVQGRKNLAFLADVGLVDEETASKIRSAKTTPVIPATGLASAGAPPLPDELRRLMSDEAVKLILSFEGFDRSTYDAHYAHPVWPGGTSGVTIGVAYDLGYTTAEQFEHDWKSQISESDFELLKRAVGITGPEAEKLVSDFSSVKINWENAIAVFYGNTLPRAAMVVDRSLSNTRELPPDSYGALVALVINRGATFDQQGDRYTEMRAIRELMADKQFNEIPAQIRSMKRLWPNIPGLQSRRELEASLFERGLSVARSGSK